MVDAVSSTKVTEHEVILVNGTPVQLVGEDGEALKRALLEGRLPDQSILNRVLSSVLGCELKGVAKVESNVTMTSKVTTRDTLTVHHNGKVVDERTAESKYDTVLQGHINDTYKPGEGVQSLFSSASTTPNCSPRPPIRASRMSSLNSCRRSASRTSSRASRSPSSSAPSKSSSTNVLETNCSSRGSSPAIPIILPSSSPSIPILSGSSSPALEKRASRTSTSSGSSGVGSSSGCSSGESPPIDPIKTIMTMTSLDCSSSNDSPSCSSSYDSGKAMERLSLSAATSLNAAEVANFLPPPSPLVESLAKAEASKRQMVQDGCKDGAYVKIQDIHSVSTLTLVIYFKNHLTIPLSFWSVSYD